MNWRMGVFLLSAALVACSSSSSDEAPGPDDEGTKQEIAKQEGDSCACTNSEMGLDLIGCSGRDVGCFKDGMSCELSRPIAFKETGEGTCRKQCTRSEKGTQGSCAAGQICLPDAAGISLICT